MVKYCHTDNRSEDVGPAEPSCKVRRYTREVVILNGLSFSII